MTREEYDHLTARWKNRHKLTAAMSPASYRFAHHLPQDQPLSAGHEKKRAATQVWNTSVTLKSGVNGFTHIPGFTCYESCRYDMTGVSRGWQGIIRCRDCNNAHARYKRAMRAAERLQGYPVHQYRTAVFTLGPRVEYDTPEEREALIERCRDMMIRGMQTIKRRAGWKDVGMAFWTYEFTDDGRTLHPHAHMLFVEESPDYKVLRASATHNGTFGIVKFDKLYTYVEKKKVYLDDLSQEAGLALGPKAVQTTVRYFAKYITKDIADTIGKGKKHYFQWG